MPDLSTEAIVYGEAVRAIAGQERALNDLRARTAMLVAAGGVVSAFLGNAGVSKNGFGVFGGLAAIAFALTVSACVWILVPSKKAWIFECSAKVLLEDHVDVTERNDARRLYRFLAEALDGHYERNEGPLEQRMNAFWWACIGLAVTIGLWLLELAFS